MTDYTKLVEALRACARGVRRCDECYQDTDSFDCQTFLMRDAAAAIEALQAEVGRLQDKLCDWCAVCPKERRKPENCELLSETPVMYGPSDAKMEVQDG